MNRKSAEDYQIALEGMSFHAYHGVYPEEQKVGRTFKVSVYLDCELFIDGSDELGETFNYEWIYEIVKREMEEPKKLLETLIYNIKKKILAKSDIVKGGLIRIQKEGLPLGGKVARSALEHRFLR